MTLTWKQTDYLRRRGSMDSKTRSRYDFKLLKKLKLAINDFDDLRMLLKFMPKASIRRAITDDQLFNHLEVTLRLIDSMDCKPYCQSTDDDILRRKRIAQFGEELMHRGGIK